MRIYPPLLFNAIFVETIHPTFRYARIRIKKCILNRNLHGTIFGGTMACAADPWHGLLFWQILVRKRIPALIWVRAAQYEYLKPASSDLIIEVQIPEMDVQHAISALQTEGRFVKTYIVNEVDQENEICCQAQIVLIIQNPERSTKTQSTS